MPERGAGVTPDEFRAALARWASGVVVVSVREGARIHATTATSFASVSLRPPLVVVALGAGAQVLPFLEEDVRFVATILAARQRRYATLYADSFPVGPTPFPAAGEPRIAGAHATLVCSVVRHVEAGDARLVIARVEEAEPGEDPAPLVRHERTYHRLSPLD